VPPLSGVEVVIWSGQTEEADVKQALVTVSQQLSAPGELGQADWHWLSEVQDEGQTPPVPVPEPVVPVPLPVPVPGFPASKVVGLLPLPEPGTITTPDPLPELEPVPEPCPSMTEPSGLRIESPWLPPHAAARTVMEAGTQSTTGRENHEARRVFILPTLAHLGCRTTAFRVRSS
jgi:hypothetical protein